MENLISIFLNSVFVGNILLAYFLGMCSFVAVSKNIETATGLGFAVVFVLTVTTPLNWLIYQFLLAPGALSWAGYPGVDLSFLKLRKLLLDHYYKSFTRGAAGLYSQCRNF